MGMVFAKQTHEFEKRMSTDTVLSFSTSRLLIFLAQTMSQVSIRNVLNLLHYLHVIITMFIRIIGGFLFMIKPLCLKTSCYA